MPGFQFNIKKHVFTSWRYFKVKPPGDEKQKYEQLQKKKKNTVAVDEKHRYDTQDTDTTIKIYVLV